MIETQMRALFADIAGEPAPSQADTERARRRGRARLRWRRADQAGAPVLAATAVTAVALLVGAGPLRLGPGPAATQAAPRQFDPLVPYASFGWLPAGSRSRTVTHPGRWTTCWPGRARATRPGCSRCTRTAAAGSPDRHGR